MEKENVKLEGRYQVVEVSYEVLVSQQAKVYINAQHRTAPTDDIALTKYKETL